MLKFVLKLFLNLLKLVVKWKQKLIAIKKLISKIIHKINKRKKLFNKSKISQ